MRKILIVGCSGSGKSTLARVLGNKLSIPVFHLDQYFWDENSNKLSKEEQYTIARTLRQKECWIIDGMYMSTFHEKLQKPDTIIVLDLPTLVCLGSVLKRTFAHLAGYQKRNDGPQGLQAGMTMEFLKWILTYRRDHLPILLNNIGLYYPEARVITIKSRKNMSDFVDNCSK